MVLDCHLASYKTIGIEQTCAHHSLIFSRLIATYHRLTSKTPSSKSTLESSWFAASCINVMLGASLGPWLHKEHMTPGASRRGTHLCCLIHERRFRGEGGWAPRTATALNNTTELMVTGGYRQLYGLDFDSLSFKFCRSLFLMLSTVLHEGEIDYYN
jgi:hypothetical protein